MSTMDDLARHRYERLTAVDKFRTVVEHLNIHPDSLAATFHKIGLRGSRAPDLDCPLAMFVAGACGHDVATTETEVVLMVSPALNVKMALPPGACEFIRRFDAGLYPELER